MIAELEYANESDWLRLPDWVHFFFKLGAAFSGRVRHTTNRTVIAVVAPTRSFGAVFAATGIVTANPQARIDLDAHVKQVQALPVDSTVWLRGDDRVWYADRWMGMTTFGGAPYFRVRDERTGGIGLRSLTRAATVRRRQGNRFLGPEYRSLWGFIEEAFPGVAGLEHLARMGPDLTIVGQTTLLDTEIHTEIRVPFRGGETIAAPLQSVLRADRWSDGADPGLCQIVPESQATRYLDRARRQPPLTIFDGAAAFRKASDLYTDAHWLVLLDRTDSGFADACQALNQRHIRRTSTQWDPGVVPPAGLEMMVFEEAR